MPSFHLAIRFVTHRNPVVLTNVGSRVIIDWFFVVIDISIIISRNVSLAIQTPHQFIVHRTGLKGQTNIIVGIVDRKRHVEHQCVVLVDGKVLLGGYRFLVTRLAIILGQREQNGLDDAQTHAEGLEFHVDIRLDHNLARGSGELCILYVYIKVSYEWGKKL